MKNLLLPFVVIATMILGASVHAFWPNHGARAAVLKKPVIADPVARLQARLDQGSARLSFDKQFGYLPSVLKELRISASSQLLIFSKTSLQVALISPQTPHAVYFTDDVAVGFVPGTNLLELASVDPKEGVYFYTLNQQDTPAPRFQSVIGCLNCHKTAATLNIQGWLTKSVSTDSSGVVDASSSVVNTSHETPFKKRWGGWYVTGTTGKEHQGNMLLHDPSNLANMSGELDTGRFLTAYSDVVALMVLEHQAHMLNLILHVTDVADSSPGKLDHAVEELVEYMLFIREAQPSEPVQGTSGFSAEFAQQGPRDKKGRSLRDFDLNARLFRYPCTYMIYSDAFDAIPASALRRVYRRLWEVLTGRDKSPRFAGIRAAKRKEVLEILRDTKHGLPDYWFGKTREVSEDQFSPR